MNHPPVYHLTFPCPNCAATLTIHAASASAPCPYCRQDIEILLSSNVKQEPDEASIIRLERNTRRFRPTTKVADLDARRAHKFSD